MTTLAVVLTPKLGKENRCQGEKDSGCDEDIDYEIDGIDGPDEAAAQTSGKIAFEVRGLKLHDFNDNPKGGSPQYNEDI